MPKSFNEMGDILKAIIFEANNDARNKKSFRIERYNNMKLTMDPEDDRNPHVVIQIGMSIGKYDIITGERKEGSLGPDERYIGRWFKKMGVLDSLQELWKIIIKKNKVGAEIKEDRDK